MLRLVRLAAIVFLAVVAADLLFRASLLRLVRPVIVSPADGEVVAAPVRVRWEGPRQMRVTLRHAGRDKWDLGVRESPFLIPAEDLRGRGLYSIEVRSPTFGDWVSAQRSFSTDGSVEAPEGKGERQAGEPRSDDVGSKLAALEESLQEMRDAQEDSHDENTNLYEENAAIREENAILTEELQQVSESEQRALGQLAALQQEYARLVEEHRLMLLELSQLRSRLDTIVPCSVWGYFSYPRPRTIPPTRRVVVVSDAQGEVFRTQNICERVRRRDSTSASVCFCVGSSFGE